jgi:hypothetical protein
MLNVDRQDLVKASWGNPWFCLTAPAPDLQHTVCQHVDVRSIPHVGVHEAGTPNLFVLRCVQMRENIKLRRGFLMSTTGVMSPYVHTAAGYNMGRIIGIVALETPSGAIDEVCAAAEMPVQQPSTCHRPCRH